MVSWIAAILIGIALLTKGADFFVDGASATAKRAKVDPLVIGIVLVGFVTAVPEMVVSALAAWHGQLGMSVGNAIGSSIANIGLVIGGTALFEPMKVYANVVRQEYPALLIAMCLATMLVLDQTLSRSDGLILLLGFLVLMTWLVKLAKKRTRDNVKVAAEWLEHHPERHSIKKIAAYFVVGLAALLLGSQLLIVGATGIAKWFGISDFVIGLTIVAIGTSLPELAASLVAAKKGEHEIALGNVVGSNLFNMLMVLAMPALIIPGRMPVTLLTRDIPIMFGFTLMLFVMSYGCGDSKPTISRLEGGVLLTAFSLYNILVCAEIVM